MGRAVLYCQCSDDGSDDGADNLQHLEYFLPVDFHFTQSKFERNTLFIKSPAERKEMAEIMAAHDNLNDILQRRKISFISFISAGQNNRRSQRERGKERAGRSGCFHARDMDDVSA